MTFTGSASSWSVASVASRAIEPHADAERAARVETDQRRGLAALAVEAPSGEFDQAGLAERRDDAADGRARQVRVTGEVGFRRGLGAAQRLQQQALVVAAHVGRVAALTDMGASHASPPGNYRRFLIN